MTKHSQMLDFWSERASRYGDDPRANTNDIWLRELEREYIAQFLAKNRVETVLDFGCANGYTTHLLADQFTNIQLLGVDLNSDMIAAANARLKKHPLKNLDFRTLDITNTQFDRKFDCVLCIRVLQNIESDEHQRVAFARLAEHLNAGGWIITIETYEEGYEILNRDRVDLGLERLPFHSHLTLLTRNFDTYAATVLQLVRSEPFASSYYLVTRLVYSQYAKLLGEPINYDHLLHRVAAQIPQVGAYGPMKAAIYRKPP